ncbi:MAG: hypothetical protein ACTHU0_32525 [Kofleriaceae bacterium]
MTPRTRVHPLDHHPAFRAAVAAAPPLAALSARLAGADLVGALAHACSDLAAGFAAPPDSPRRREAHHRAWIAMREIDRTVSGASRQKLAPQQILRRAQRAVDRADVLIGALLPG